MINITRKKDTATQKSLVLGMCIGVFATLIVSSKKLRARFKRTMPESNKRQLKNLQESADSKVREAKQKAPDAKNKVADNK